MNKIQFRLHKNIYIIHSDLSEHNIYKKKDFCSFFTFKPLINNEQIEEFEQNVSSHSPNTLDFSVDFCSASKP